jgi:two-component system cell cycle sensor histidine kinase/response regulator CckA
MGRITGRILIVDDEPSLLKMMSVYLGRLGYQVKGVSTTEQAWNEVKAAPEEFAVVVLDATMSGLSMEDLGLRILNVNPELRLIAASGYPVDMAALEAAGGERVIFLHKPFTPEMLASAVRGMFGAQEEEL